MPLTGELEHLPIVDVIQLIHSTRKSGTLKVCSRKGEGRLVFNNGYIVSAYHSNEKYKVGQLLLEAEFVSQAELDKALDIQKTAGLNRKPLIATLIEHCGLSEKTAFQALELLIEMTVVEMISWTRGIFSLDVDEISICDDYKYLPAELQDVTLDTQMVLMDALRIFDEKVHAGEIVITDEPFDEEFDEDLSFADEESDVKEESEEIVVSEDILGLADLDKIERKKPRVFKSLEAFDPSEIHRQAISKAFPELNADHQNQLANYLMDAAQPVIGSEWGHAVGKSQAIIIYTADEFILHAIMTVCKREGVMVFTANKEEEIDQLIERAQDRLLEPILIFGSPNENQPAFSQETITRIRSEKIHHYAQLSVIQLASPFDYAFSLQSLNDGIRAVLPKPYYAERPETFVEDTINFLNTFQSYIHGCFNEERRLQFAKLRNSLSGLRLLSKAPDISLSVLQFVSEVFERALTLVVDKTDMIAERSIGIITDRSVGASMPLKIRLPFLENSLFQKLIDKPEIYYGPANDALLEECLFPEIVAPLEPQILLLPLVSNNRLITVTYADFGQKKAGHVPLDFLEFFVSQAGISMENALFRRQLDKKPQTASFQ